MKFNWGHGITLFLTIFVLSMLFVVYKGFQQDNQLVEKEYYPKGLEYEKHIRQTENAKELGEQIGVTESNGTVQISYPEFFRSKEVKGTVYFYRPSDEAGDLTLKMEPDSALKQVVDSRRLLKGKYMVKMNWSKAGKDYYQETSLFVQH